MDAQPTDSPTRERKRQLRKAIRQGRNTEVLDALRKQRFSPTEVIKKGARYGNLPFLKDYLDRLAGGTFHGIQRGDRMTDAEEGIQRLRRTQYHPWILETSIMKAAVKREHMPTARYLCDKGFGQEKSELLYIAVKNGNLEMVKMLDPKLDLIQTGMDYAACAGQKHILEWFKENGGELEPCMSTAALEVGHLECAKWIAERVCCGSWIAQHWHYTNKFGVNYCTKEDSDTHIKCLEDSLRTEDTRVYNNLPLATGNLECLRYIDGIGCRLTARMFRKAVVAWNVPCMEYLHEKKCPWTSKMITDAIAIGNVACIDWLKNHDYLADACLDP